MATSLDKKSYVPLSKQIADIIIERIVQGVYRVNDAIPSQSQLQKEFDVSLITVRLAFKELSSKGVIETSKGRSTIVKKIPSNLQRNYHTLRGFTTDQQKRKVKFSVLHISTHKGTVHVRNMLELKKDEEVVTIERRGEIDNVSVTMQVSHLNSALASHVNWNKELRDGVSLYALLRTKKNITVEYAEEDIDAVICPEKHLSIFSIKKNTPLLFIKRKTYARQSTRPFEYCEYYILSQYYGTITILQK